MVIAAHELLFVTEKTFALRFFAQKATICGQNLDFVGYMIVCLRDMYPIRNLFSEGPSSLECFLITRVNWGLGGNQEEKSRTRELTHPFQQKGRR